MNTKGGEGLTEIECKVVGVTFDNHQQVIKEIIKEVGVEELLLIREPDNPADANAIRVEVSGLRVGYIPADTAKEIAPRMATRRYYQAYLVKLNEYPYGTTIGLSIRFTLS